MERLQELLYACAVTETDSMHLCATHSAAQERTARRANDLKEKGVPYVTAVAEDRLVACQQTPVTALGSDEPEITPQ